ncbi:MAG: ATP-binding cassette domain-containing protein [Ruminococcaceae bacterium]|nr:ATP-binding cassette domain-containing protein [Oscillospiraceae bacterium]
MESIRVENVSFTYPTKTNKALDNINFTVNQGEFVLLCGKSGCGKTTLLRLLMPSLSPFGTISGNISLGEKPLSDYDAREQAKTIGFVMQNPDNQIVTDKVWHELAFGLESLGYKTPEIRARVSEMASFFGIENWFYKNVTELSGGQKQLLCLASVMACGPSVLILDEPTSQLDPIAAGEFLKTLEKINRELGTMVILSEHRLEDALPLTGRVIVMDRGKIIADASPDEVGSILKSENHDMYKALPTPMRVHGEVVGTLPSPLTVRDGRVWLEKYAKENPVNPDMIPNDTPCDKGDTVIEVKDAWFRYEKKLPDAVKGLNVKVSRGELFCLAGGNGTGKTTALSMIAGLNAPYRGDVLINGQSVFKIKNAYEGLLGVLPQNPQSVFAKKTVYLDLMEMVSDKKFTKEEQEQKALDIATLCRIEALLDSHPYDLSGGEQQRAALAKVLLTEPAILLLDEPTKGMDAGFKEEFADILFDLKSAGTTILMVSHDIEFCAKYADRCALMFDGSITSEGAPRAFFKGKNFYTTAANRMARTCLPDAVLAEDILLACGKSIQKREKKVRNKDFAKTETESTFKEETSKKLSPARIIAGSLFALLFVLIPVSFLTNTNLFGIANIGLFGMGALQIISLAVAASCFFPQRELGASLAQTPRGNRRLTKRTLASTFLILLLIPLTIYTGVFFFGSRKYYIISLLIMLETMIPFGMVFESRKPKARELIIVSVLCALSVAGRAAFFMLPEFKPIVALVIIAGVCFGGETGFLVGAMSGFVSNFFFGQGPWTPWQMFAFGIIGFLAGILFKKGFLRKTRLSLCIFGFLATLIIYGGIMNPGSVIMWQRSITAEMIFAACIAGFPMDLVHSCGTAFFLWFLSAPMIDKLERVKVKYGLVESTHSSDA